MKNNSKLKNIFNFSLRDTLVTIAVFAVASGLCFILQNFSENDFHVPLIFVLAVLIISRSTNGYFYGLISTFAGVIAVNYIFTYPYFELDFSLTGYPLTFVTMLLVSLVTCTMTTRIKTQERMIRESEKEKIRSELLRGISHDIRTPLTGIAGVTNTLLENDDIPKEKQKELLKDAYDDSQWLIRMVENVLIITRIGEDPEKINKTPEIVEEVFSEAVYKFRKQWPEVKVNVNVPDEVLFVQMDAMLIEQVIMNILHNSVIHGSSTLIEINIMKNGKNAEFVFKDNGSGFRFDEKGEILNESSRGRTDRQKNMGIGLSVCRAIVKAHKGEIDFKNAPDKGAVVTIKLPIEG